VAYTFDQLKAKPLAELRDLAKQLDEETVKGWSQMNKERLLPVLCKALHVDTHVHHEVVGVDKAAIKARLRQLHLERDRALETHDLSRLKVVRREMHHVNHRIRRATV
jgi:hypothetical protein